MTWSQMWDRLAGGAIPVVRRQLREVFVVDGAAYRIELVWFRRAVQLKYTTPRIPRDVRGAREADRARGEEMLRRHRAGEPTVQVGDLIPVWATAFVARCHMVRDSEGTRWRRVEDDERYGDGGGCGERSTGQEYDWVAFLAGEWGGGWCTDEGLLDHAPLTVLELADRATS